MLGSLPMMQHQKIEKNITEGNNKHFQDPSAMLQIFLY
jgi:hypothetical protein